MSFHTTDKGTVGRLSVHAHDHAAAAPCETTSHTSDTEMASVHYERVCDLADQWSDGTTFHRRHSGKADHLHTTSAYSVIRA